MSVFDTAPDLYVPYWETGMGTTTLAIHAVQIADIAVRVYGNDGLFLSETVVHLTEGEVGFFVLGQDIAAPSAGDGSLFLTAQSPIMGGDRPTIAAETVVNSGQGQPLRFHHLNARLGTWTTFKPSWIGHYEDPNTDELLLFCPAIDLEAEIRANGSLPGNPQDAFPSQLRVRIFDDQEILVYDELIPCAALFRGTLSSLSPDPLPIRGSIQVDPRLPNEDVVALAGVRRGGVVIMNSAE